MTNPKKFLDGKLFLIMVLTLSLVGITGCGSQSTSVGTSQNTSGTVTAGETVPMGYPPQIPHSLEERSQCLVCHQEGEAGNAPKTPHPELTNCRQCHVLIE